MSILVQITPFMSHPVTWPIKIHEKNLTIWGMSLSLFDLCLINNYTTVLSTSWWWVVSLKSVLFFQKGLWPFRLVHFCRARLLENLSKLQHVPSVPFSERPPDTELHENVSTNKGLISNVFVKEPFSLVLEGVVQKPYLTFVGAGRWGFGTSWQGAGMGWWTFWLRLWGAWTTAPQPGYPCQWARFSKVLFIIPALMFGTRTSWCLCWWGQLHLYDIVR